MCVMMILGPHSFHLCIRMCEYESWHDYNFGTNAFNWNEAHITITTKELIIQLCASIDPQIIIAPDYEET